jgi:site-specific recombinase XerD
VLIYAEFLASYYNRTLASGDYATLDECLFYYYPRRVTNTSPRQVREICTSIKQFYSFMMERGVIVDDRFAQALWRRRDQAARVIEIYDRISSDSPSFEALFARLFQPYTE